MKNTFRFLTLIAVIQLFTILFSTVSAQKIKSEEVPDDVIQTLDFENPGVKVTSWVKESNVYVASFKDEGAIGKIYISSVGTWLKTTYSIPKDELPPAITDYCTENYPNYPISVSLLQSLPDVKMHYYIEVKPEGVGVKSSVLTFNEMGNLIDRKDPPGFVDPKIAIEEAEKTAANAKEAPKKGSNQPAKKTTPSKPTPKPTAAKPADSKPVAAKPTTKKDTKPSAAKSPKSTPKKEKVKKEKPIKPVEDEFGNIALNPATIPAPVTKALTKKVQRPEELNWFKIDTFLVAKCIAKEQKNEIFFSDKGIWEKTYIHLPEEAVTGNMIKHIKSFYKGYRFKQAIRELRADKKDITMVEIYEKANWKTKLVTTVIFDKTGKLIRSIDPDYTLGGQDNDESEDDQDLEKYYEKMNMSDQGETNKDIPSEVLNAFKAKYPRVNHVDWEKDEQENYLAIYYGSRGKEICVINAYGTLLETQTLGNIDNVSANIKSYIKSEHKGAKILEYYAVRKLLDKKNFYKVIIQEKKTKEEIELWFTTAGKIIEL